MIRKGPAIDAGAVLTCPFTYQAHGENTSTAVEVAVCSALKMTKSPIGKMNMISVGNKSCESARMACSLQEFLLQKLLKAINVGKVALRVTFSRLRQSTACIFA